MSIEITGDDLSHLVIKFFNKAKKLGTPEASTPQGATPGAPTNDLTGGMARTPNNEALNPRMQQAITTKQSLAAVKSSDLPPDPSLYMNVNAVRQQQLAQQERLFHSGSLLAPRKQGPQGGSGIYHPLNKQQKPETNFSRNSF